MLQGQAYMDKTLGTRENPYKSSKDIPSSLKLSGPSAVKKVEQLIGGSLTLAQRRVVEEEGFVNAFYYDDAKKPVLTYGIGQTNEYIDKGFLESFNAHKKRAMEAIPRLKDMPEELQAEIIQLEYRGDLRSKTGNLYKWVNQINNGEYNAAAKELLNHSEYKERKEKGNDGVTRRLEIAQNAIFNFADQIDIQTNNKARKIDLSTAEKINKGYQ
jgi:GH24 family phage-related lysozyme (muramidase)